MIVKPPTVFVAYAWEDDVNVWVREFATRLRREGGVDVQIDQWAAAPGTPLPEFMETSVRTSDFILIVCTPKYKLKSDKRLGGVGYEGDIITSEIFAKANHHKFIPVLRKGEWTEAAPSFLLGKKFIDMRRPDEAAYQELLKTLHGRLGVLPTIGAIPVFDGGPPVTGGASPDTRGRGSVQEFGAVAPPDAVRAASLPASVHTPIPAPSSPVRAAATPTMGTSSKRSALWPWLIVLAAIILVGSVLFAFLASRFSDADRGAAASTGSSSIPIPGSQTTNVCCGGVDCPKEQERTEGTSCARPDACRPCKSGRRRVAGACADPIPSTNTYRLRLAGVTTPGYKPDPTDTICVQRAGATAVCAMVSDANANAVLGLTRIADLTADVDVWFDRSKTRMRSLRGMRIQRPMSQFMNSALCVGAVLYSADESEIVRFYLEDP